MTPKSQTYQAYGLSALAGPIIATSMIMTQAFILSGVLSAVAALGTLLLSPPQWKNGKERLI